MACSTHVLLYALPKGPYIKMFTKFQEMKLLRVFKLHRLPGRPSMQARINVRDIERLVKLRIRLRFTVRYRDALLLRPCASAPLGWHAPPFGSRRSSCRL